MIKAVHCRAAVVTRYPDEHHRPVLRQVDEGGRVQVNRSWAVLKRRIREGNPLRSARASKMKYWKGNREAFHGEGSP